MFNLAPLSLEGKSIQLTTLIRILVPLAIIAIAVGLYFVLPKKSQKGIKITKICIASTLLGLYLFKFFFWIARIVSISSSHTFTVDYLPRALGLDVSSYLILLMSATLYISAFVKKPCKLLNFFENTLLGIGLTYGIILLFRLDLIDVYDNLFHALNIQSMIFMLALIFVPIYLIKIKELQPKLSSFWYAVAGHIAITSLCMTGSLLLRGGNLSEMTFSYSLKQLGLKIDFPWHLLIVIPAFLIICFVVYYVISYINNKFILKINETKSEYRSKNEFFDLHAFSTKSLCCLQGFLILILLAAVIRQPQGTPLGLLCLIPFVMTIFCVLTVFEMEKLSTLAINDETIFDKNNKKLKKASIYLMFANLVFGLSFKKQIKNEREAIEDRKLREERRKQKLQQKLEQQKLQQQQEEENGKI